MKLPTLSDLRVSNKTVILRADLDVKIIDGRVVDDARIEVFLRALKELLKKNPKRVTILAHLGRPGGKKDASLSLRPLVDFFGKNFNIKMSFVDYQPFNLFYMVYDAIFRAENKVVLLENLRFWKEEKAGSESFAKELASTSEAYVNEAFASSHRNHVSVTLLPKAILSKEPNSVAVGERFRREVENLSKVFVNPKRPVLVVISGKKEDKLSHIDDLKRFADKILIGGRLSEFYPDSEDPSISVAELTTDRLDINDQSIKRFEEEIAKAGTIVLSGPLGKFEDLAHRQGTERVLRAISSNLHAFRVAGGGDTETAISELKLEKGFDWISVGGGAMLEFLAKGTLPGIEALVN